MEGSENVSRPLTKFPLARAAALAGLLFTTDCVGRSCGESDGLDQGRQETLGQALNCVEASQGNRLTNAEKIDTDWSPETGDQYFELEALRGFCKEKLGLSISEAALALSANSTFADGTKVRVGNVIETVPVAPVTE